MERGPEKHLAIFRSFAPADLFTLANASSGMIAIFLCLNHVEEHTPYLWIGFIFLFVAMICDVLDGVIARHSKHSVLGADLDSLADIISFGVAPAVLGFTLGMRGLWDAIVLIYFVTCGISRLARYNVTTVELADEKGKVKYYQGTPITTSIVIVAILGIAYWLGRIDNAIPLGSLRLGPSAFHPFTLIYALSGSLMISSTLHIPKP